MEQLDDVTAALAFLKGVPGIDPGRIAIAGHSDGGNLTLLAAERVPSFICQIHWHDAWQVTNGL
jgi:dipeptidyl aminopeptidase/acylaminoacyl peptidase